MYGEIIETKQGKDVGAFYACPGLTLFATWGDGPIRAMHEYAGTAELFVVSGNTLFGQGAAHDTPISLGNIGPPGTAWSFNPKTQAFAQITLPFEIPASFNSDTVTIVDNSVELGIFVGISASEQDGFVLANQPGTYNIYQSDLLDLTSWDALNFGAASGHSDTIVALAQIHLETFVLLTTNTEIWINAGTPGFAFQRLQGVFIEAGCVAQASVVKAGEELMWLGRNREGHGVVVRLRGYQPIRVSTHMIEREIQSYSRMDDAVGYAYQQEGHLFYVLNFPTGNATWVYDVTASEQAGIPMWQQRASFAGGAFSRHWGNCYALLAADPVGLNLVGDYRNGNIYQFDLNAQLDNGTQRKFLRSWRALPKPSEDPVTFSSLRIDMQTGVGVPDGTDPLCVLRWSDDGGHTWSNERVAHVGKTGETARRVKFNRLGSTRRNSGLDRIFEWSSTDQFGIALIGAELEAG